MLEKKEHNGYDEIGSINFVPINVKIILCLNNPLFYV